MVRWNLAIIIIPLCDDLVMLDFMPENIYFLDGKGSFFRNFPS